MNDTDQIVLLFDPKLRRPGCVILQAMAGCGHNNGFMEMNFDNWLTSPTPDMKRISGTRQQWEGLAAKIRKAKPTTPPL